MIQQRREEKTVTSLTVYGGSGFVSSSSLASSIWSTFVSGTVLSSSSVSMNAKRESIILSVSIPHDARMPLPDWRKTLVSFLSVLLRVVISPGI